MNLRLFALFVVVLFQPLLLRADWRLSEMVRRNAGQPTFNAKPVERRFLNPWPAKLEAEFQQRAHRIITARTRNVRGGVNT